MEFFSCSNVESKVYVRGRSARWFTLHGTHETGPGSKPFVGEKTTSRTQRRRRLEKPPLKQLLVPYSFNHECRNTFSFERHKFLSQNVQKQLSSPILITTFLRSLLSARLICAVTFIAILIGLHTYICSNEKPWFDQGKYIERFSVLNAWLAKFVCLYYKQGFISRFFFSFLLKLVRKLFVIPRTLLKRG